MQLHFQNTFCRKWPLIYVFEQKKNMLFLVVDYYSCYIEVCSLRSITSASVIHKLKTVFARHGISVNLVSDSGPQFSSQDFCSFSKDYGFNHVTSSPNYPQANREAEWAVCSLKMTICYWHFNLPLNSFAQWI